MRNGMMVRMASHARFETVTLDARYALQVETRQTHAKRDGKMVLTHVSKGWWLIEDGVPVAYLKTLFDARDAESTNDWPLMLCDIEVRPEHRGAGHTRRIVGAVEQIEGHRVWTSGGFTPMGAVALSWLPVCPAEAEYAGVVYDDMTFVEDWDTLVSKFPL